MNNLKPDSKILQSTFPSQTFLFGHLRLWIGLFLSWTAVDFAGAQSANPFGLVVDPKSQVEADEYKEAKNECQKMTGRARKDCLDAAKAAFSGKPNRCDELAEKVFTAQQDLSKVCSDAGMGSSCYKIAASCVESSGNSGPNAQDTLLDALVSQSLGIQGGSQLFRNEYNADRICSPYSGADYTEVKKDLQQQIDDKKKELQEEGEKITDLDKDLAEAKKEAEENIRQAKQDMEETLKKLDEEEQEKIQDLQEAVLKAEDEQDSIALTKIKISGEINNTQIQLQVTRNNGSRIRSQCVLQIEKLQLEQKDRPVRGGGLSSFAGAAGSRRKRLLEEYKTCISNSEKALSGQIQSLENTIRSKQQEMVNAQNQLERKQKELDNAKASLNTYVQNKQKYVQQANENFQKTTQTEQQALFEKEKTQLQEKQNITQRQWQLNQDIAALEQEKRELGPPPPGGKKSKESVVSVKNQAKDLLAQIKSFSNQCCPRGSDNDSGHSACEDIQSYGERYENSNSKPRRGKGKSRSNTGSSI